MPPKRGAKSPGGTSKKSKGEAFPIDLLGKFKKLSIDPFTTTTLSDQQKADLQSNIELCRDTIVFFTACGSASGYGGHTGGAFDTVPEVMLLDAFFRACPDKFVPIFFDEAGHRVATQYLMSVLRGHMDANQLKQYRVGHEGLPGHPELDHTPGVEFSSGRLGHMWPFVNGVAMANPEKICVCLGSDGSQMEGNDAEAARLAVAHNLNVKLIIDDNDVTIAGHPSDYFKGYSVEGTLQGHGMLTKTCVGEDMDSLYAAVRNAMVYNGPFGVVAKRKMSPGIEDVEGTCGGHDAIPAAKGIKYLEARGYKEAVAYLKGITKSVDTYEYTGAGKIDSNRNVFGSHMVSILGKMSEKDRKANVMVIDSDLEGSCGLNKIGAAFPEIYVKGGIMERGNFSAAAGFGMVKGKQGVFATFAAFLEMCTSEITMARLNKSNVLCHFSHSGSDDMADNTCHFGINNMFADNGLETEDSTRLYFPGDANQLKACLDVVFPQPGLRFVFTTRSKVPQVLDDKGNEIFAGNYKFKPGKDDLVRTGTAGYIVSFGDALYRCVDAVDRLKKEGVDVGLINKSTLNVVDEDMIKTIGKTGFVLVVEPLSQKTGLGSK
jgi:transketolase